MADLCVIDRFTETFSHYINSGFGLLSGDVSFLSSTLVGIDLTLAALPCSARADDQILVTFAKKVLYVGAFAFIIGNFKSLAAIVFAAFSGIGLKASGGAAKRRRPGAIGFCRFSRIHGGSSASGGARPILPPRPSDQPAYDPDPHVLLDIDRARALRAIGAALCYLD